MTRLIALFVLLTASASAQIAPIQDIPPLSQERPPLDPTGAVALSIGATTVPVILGTAAMTHGEGAGLVLVLGGLAVGPSVSNLVLGEYRDAAVGAGLRVLGAGVVVGGFAVAFWNESDLQVSLAEAAMLIGTGTFVAGALHDVVGSAVNAHRQRVRIEPRGAGLALTVGL